MKRELRLHLMGILILVFCVSCGHSVEETIEPAVTGAASGQFMRVAIVPFADHTANSSLSDHFRRNTMVLEALQDALYGAGFISAAEEDVVKYLVDRGVIRTSSGNANTSGTALLEKEMSWGWSSQMKEEIGDVISSANQHSGGKKGPESIALDRQTLINLGDVFAADYIVRGRIVEYRADQIDSFNPLRTGMIPIVFKSGQRAGMGIAESEMYEYFDKDDVVDYDLMRNFFWGAGGFLTGLIGEKQGRVPGATVQIRVLVQDAKTGDVVWLNRAEACSLPRSAFSDPNTELLFAKAVDRAVNSLVDDFASAFASGRIAKSAEAVSDSEEGQGSNIDSFLVEVATEKAERSAKEAADSAKEAKESAEQAVAAAGEAKAYALQAGEAEGHAQRAEDAASEAKDAVKRASEASVKSEKIFKKIIAK